MEQPDDLALEKLFSARIGRTSFIYMFFFNLKTEYNANIGTLIILLPLSSKIERWGSLRLASSRQNFQFFANTSKAINFSRKKKLKTA